MAGVVALTPSVWADRRVLVTGHTGFKGSWLTLWLASMGAHVHGYALDPDHDLGVFTVARVTDVMASDTRGDLADRRTLESTLAEVEPELVLHLAAQPLVSVGYMWPAETWLTNVQGSVNLLEAVRRQPSARAVVVVTTDKVYEDSGSMAPHGESDRLGGHDPYSSSKAAVELLVASYRKSFWSSEGENVALATVRAGNVIGGGDWGADRLVPDCLRAFDDGRPAILRSPMSVRPWQHVLEPLYGYLLLSERLMGSHGDEVASDWNFGPDPDDEAGVADLAGLVAAAWGCGAEVLSSPDSGQIHERKILRLDSTKARSRLGWSPRWDLVEAVGRTVAWNRALSTNVEMREVCLTQISDYIVGT